jgi:hypothetical protein
MKQIEKLVAMQNEVIKEPSEMVSLNERLYDEFFIQELEMRLETDPLLLGEFLGIFNGELSAADCDFTCSGTYTTGCEHSACNNCWNICNLCLDCICLKF